MATMQEVDWIQGVAARRRRLVPRALNGHLHRRDAHDAHDAQTLAHVIEGEIIPRLLLAHRNDPGRTIQIGEPPVGVVALDVDTMAPMVLTQDTYALLRHVEGFLARGVSVRTVFVDLLAPVARRLGEFWEADACDFIDVTMGLWRLQEVVREVSERTPGVAATGVGRSALFAPIPGEQHSFGSVMVEELFRRSGWRTFSAIDGDARTLEMLVAGEGFDLVGLTVSVAEHLEDAPATIASLRAASRNADIVVMVGGAAVGGRAEIARHVGADGTAANAAEAVTRAERLLADRARRGVAA